MISYVPKRQAGVTRENKKLLVVFSLSNIFFLFFLFSFCSKLHCDLCVVHWSNLVPWRARLFIDSKRNRLKISLSELLLSVEQARKQGCRVSWIKPGIEFAQIVDLRIQNGCK